MKKRGLKPQFTSVSCPNADCELYGLTDQGNVVGNGTYISRGEKTRRYCCRHCGKVFNTYRHLHRIKTDHQKSLNSYPLILIPYSYPLILITSGAQRVTNTPFFTGFPTIIGSNKKVLKRKQIGSLNQKRRNSFITEGNCRTACLGWGGRPQFDFHQL